MTPIPTNIDWHKLSLAFGKAKITPNCLEEFEVGKSLIYHLRAAQSEPNPTWHHCKCLWNAAQARLSLEEIQGCIVDD